MAKVSERAARAKREAFIAGAAFAGRGGNHLTAGDIIAEADARYPATGEEPTRPAPPAATEPARVADVAIDALFSVKTLGITGDAGSLGGTYVNRMDAAAAIRHALTSRPTASGEG